MSTRSTFEANRAALITGASSGIGLELARVIAPRVESLILVARRRERLEDLARELVSRRPALRICVLDADLSDPAAVEELVRRIEAESPAVDVLVNNAGFGESELFDRSDWSRVSQLVHVNVLAMLRLTHALLPPMIGRGHGAILNIGSGAGYSAMSNAAVYTASKHFVRAFTESLRAQVSGTGVIVSEAAPGPVESEFDRVAGVAGALMPGQRFLLLTARACAEDVVAGFERGAPVIFPGRNYRRLMMLQPLMPRRLLAVALSQAARKLRASRGRPR